MGQAPNLDIKRHIMSMFLDFTDFHINILKVKTFNKTNTRGLNKI